ncbi:unnamed protein product, partial [Linum tenue]
MLYIIPPYHSFQNPNVLVFHHAWRPPRRFSTSVFPPSISTSLIFGCIFEIYRRLPYSSSSNLVD